MTIADTDVFIDYLAGKGEAGRVERLLRRGALRTTVISGFELLSGARNPKQLARLVQLLAVVRTLPVRFADPSNDRAIRSGWPTVSSPAS
ncbi:MAG: hypothetical protein NTY38_30895 [Acidobacteria bacterium]|nr:hypothetical protein [Acidobacteriota bacterium]